MGPAIAGTLSKRSMPSAPELSSLGLVTAARTTAAWVVAVHNRPAESQSPRPLAQ